MKSHCPLRNIYEIAVFFGNCPSSFRKRGFHKVTLSFNHVLDHLIVFKKIVLLFKIEGEILSSSVIFELATRKVQKQSSIH